MNNAYSMEHRELTPSPFAFTAIREPFCATVQARGPPFYEGVARFRTFPLVKYRTLVLKPPIENGSVRLDWIERNPPLTFYCTPAFSYRLSYLLSSEDNFHETTVSSTTIDDDSPRNVSIESKGDRCREG